MVARAISIRCHAENTQPLVAVPKLRAISSSALANSAGRSAGNPKHFFPASTAGNQKQLVSRGKQRNAVTASPARIPSIAMPVPSERCISLSTTSTRIELNSSRAVRILPAKWQRNPQRRSRFVRRPGDWKLCPGRSTSLPDKVICRSSHRCTSHVIPRMRTTVVDERRC
jgi:hypothetical protein